jgi:hypothetical protein
MPLGSNLRPYATPYALGTRNTFSRNGEILCQKKKISHRVKKVCGAKNIGNLKPRTSLLMHSRDQKVKWSNLLSTYDNIFRLLTSRAALNNCKNYVENISVN